MFKALLYPSKRQTRIWLDRRNDVPPSKIASALKVSRPFVSKAQRIAESRISKLMRNAATINRIDLKHISPRFGFAMGYCYAYSSNTFITFSPVLGVNVWYEHERDCGACGMKSECDSILRGLAKEWHIAMPDDLDPTDLASLLFKNIRRRLGWT